MVTLVARIGVYNMVKVSIRFMVQGKLELCLGSRIKIMINIYIMPRTKTRVKVNISFIVALRLGVSSCLFLSKAWDKG